MALIKTNVVSWTQDIILKWVRLKKWDWDLVVIGESKEKRMVNNVSVL